MTVYSRSDVAAVNISQAHGGCGVTHSRPVVEGAPVKLWKLTCHPCEDILRSDPLWSATVSGIPETPDEEMIRKDQETRGQREQADATAHALEQLSKLGDLPAVLGQFMSFLVGQQSALPAGETLVATKVENPQKVISGSVEPQADETHPTPPPVNLDDLSYTDLQTLADEVGAAKARSKKEQLTVLKEYYGIA